MSQNTVDNNKQFNPDHINLLRKMNVPILQNRFDPKSKLQKGIEGGKRK
jgi:hypothetical protein